MKAFLGSLGALALVAALASTFAGGIHSAQAHPAPHHGATLPTTAPCVETRNGVMLTGTCSGVFYPLPLYAPSGAVACVEVRSGQLAKGACVGTFTPNAQPW